MVIVNSENLFLQYDLYHCGMNGENLEDSIKSNLNVIDYIQVAGVLGRTEPDIGDIDFKKSLKFGYDWISSMGGV